MFIFFAFVMLFGHAFAESCSTRNLAASTWVKMYVTVILCSITEEFIEILVI